MDLPSFPRLRGLARPAWQPYALAIALVSLAGCGHKAPEADAAMPVIAQPAQAADGAVAGRFPGEVHARYEMPLSFRVGGQLLERYADPGERVKQGQALAQLDPADANKQLANAKAALEAAEHRLEFATQQHDRDDAQFKQNLISQLQWQQTQDNYASALAGRDQAKQQYELAQNQLRYTTLVADHEGVITSRQAEVGQVLAAGQQVFGFAWMGEREVYVDVPESRVGGIATGQAAALSLPALPGRAYAAHVREIAPAADAQSHTYLVKLTVDHADPLLQLGMTADVSLQAGKAAVAAVIIPATALFHQGEHPAVWVVNPGDFKLELRPVTVSRYGERDVLLAAGLKAGERIVMQGVHTVSAGEKVTPIAPPHAEDAPQ
ncbi:efflux RND transporter periplasmic adaptor subunit [Dyella choica]|uniref:Efflux RND transporter periplasmic adaptor subunit n=1 Tax=Dyella choica TaxID=1927959 RepID=A0A432M3G0_9GAMM|nr:efflux RND transporter periplasmic adaptor subunit [Dyella choica]RUL73079.1 efflux RND transporter periplasmic adaptor subunit [Dyella choica]